jgi:hypothetical protein
MWINNFGLSGRHIGRYAAMLRDALPRGITLDTSRGALPDEGIAGARNRYVLLGIVVAALVEEAAAAAECLHQQAEKLSRVVAVFKLP